MKSKVDKIIWLVIHFSEKTIKGVVRLGLVEKNAIRVAICEDDPIDAETLCRIARDSIPCEVHRFASGEAFLNADPAGRYDVVLMDIYLGDLNGVEVLRRLRDADKRVEIVFVTNSESHALDGYGLKAARYIVKPFDREQIEEALLTVAKKIESMRGEVLSVVRNRRRFDLPLRDILYVAAQKQVCTICTQRETLKIYSSINALEASLTPPRFLRCHRSYVVNLDQVCHLDNGDFVMSNGDHVYVSVRSFRRMKAVYEARLFERARYGEL